jgi:NAD(P)H dehydrogenase (quinone)
MHALIVVDHDDSRSLTHALAQEIARGLSAANPANTFEIADLHAEGFDPRFTKADWAVHHRESRPPADVLAEQARIDRADALVLVYPVFWWAMPALLKGWIDRVFSNGWAFDFNGNEKLVKKLGHLPVHLVGVGGADEDVYARHGYGAAMQVQIDHGIFDYCGATVAGSTKLLDSELRDAAVQLQAARELGAGLFR